MASTSGHHNTEKAPTPSEHGLFNTLLLLSLLNFLTELECGSLGQVQLRFHVCDLRLDFHSPVLDCYRGGFLLFLKVCLMLVSPHGELSGGGQEGLDVLSGILEYDFVIELRDNGFSSFQCAWVSGGSSACLEKFEHMVDSDRPLDRISQVNLDLNLKLAPSGFRHLIWWLCHCSIVVCVAVMQFEVHLLHIRRHVLISKWLHVYGPLMRMTILLPFLAKVLADIAVHDWLQNVNSFLPRTTPLGHKICHGVRGRLNSYQRGFDRISCRSESSNK